MSKPRRQCFNSAIHPRLAAHLSQGTIRIINNTYVGMAADGVEVQLGTVDYDEDSIESYLRDHRTPADW